MEVYCAIVIGLYDVDALIICTFVVDGSGQVRTLPLRYVMDRVRQRQIGYNRRNRWLALSAMQWAVFPDTAVLPVQNCSYTI
jgi:hypothetical protein